MNLGKPINTSALDYYFTIDNAGNIFTSRANKAMEGAQLDLYMMVPKTFKINLSGVVLNEKTQQPLVANVDLSMKDKQPTALKTTAQGKFESKLPEINAIKISASVEGFQPKSQDLKIPALNADTTIYVEILMTPVAKKLILSGNVYNKKTDELIPNAKVDVIVRNDRKVNFKVDAPAGSFEREIPKLGRYIITASASGFINTTDSIEISDNDLSPFVKDIYMAPIEVGMTVRLKNIYFDFDKTTLKKESFVELNKVVDFLKRNNTVEIEIGGHTDDKGSDDYNASLSQGRSQAVVDYLISQGVEDFRLTAHGYGESKPIESNDSEDGRANNRRVEFTVVKK